MNNKKLIISIAFLAALAGFSGAYPLEARSQSAGNKTNYELALEALNRKNYNAAIIKFKKVLKDSPNNFMAYYNLGIAYQHIGQVDLANNCFKKATSIMNGNKTLVEKEKPVDKPDNNPVTDRKYSKLDQQSAEQDYLIMADDQFNSQHYIKAIQHYNYALKIRNDNDYALYKIAQCYVNLNNYREANKNIDSAISLNPANKDYQSLKIKIDKNLTGQVPKVSLTNLTSKRIKKDERQSFREAVTKKEEQKPIEARGQKKTPDLLPEIPEVFAEKKPSNNNLVYNYDAEYYNQKGIESYNLNDYEKAENYFLKAVQLNHSEYKAYNNLANIEFSRKNHEKSIEYYQKAIKHNSEYPEAYHNLALVYKDKNDLKKQRKYLIKAIKLDPLNSGLYCDLALNYYNGEMPEQAKLNFEKVITLDKYNFNANYNLGVIYANELNLDKAEEYLTNAIMANNNDADSYLQLANIYQTTGNYKEAMECYIKSLELNPKDAGTLISLGKIYLKNKNYENAAKVLNQAKDASPNNADIYNYLGIAYQGQKRYRDSEISLKKALSLSPNRAIFHYNLSQLYLSCGQNDKSLIEFENAIKVKPQSAQDYLDISRIYLNKNMIGYATSTIKKGLSLYPNNEYMYISLANIYTKSGNKNSAREIYDRLLRVNPQIVTNPIIKARIKSLN